jgi:hypothetical protein
MKMRFIAICTLAILLAGEACATPAVPVRSIERMLKAYAGTIGCLMSFSRKNIATYRINHHIYYVALYGIDPQCSGGSSMYHSALAVMSENSERQIFIDPAKSFPVASPSGLPQYVDRLYLKDGLLTYSAKDFGDGDARCCPSVNVEGVLSFKDGTWVVEPKQKIPQDSIPLR